jgi:hypothetical protein
MYYHPSKECYVVGENKEQDMNMNDKGLGLVYSMLVCITNDNQHCNTT